jgi:Fungal specific transcription factor domain
VNITDVCDVTSLQALLCMIMYLQCTGTIPTCYSYVSLAVAACTRMGLHRANTCNQFNVVDREVRKRIFWTLRTTETYIMTILGLPQILSDEDIDQEFPEEIDDQFITEEGLLQPDHSLTCSMKVVNAHTKLLIIMAKVKRLVLGRGKSQLGQDNGLYKVDNSRIVEIENELEIWFSQLPKDCDFPQPIAVEAIRYAVGFPRIYNLTNEFQGRNSSFEAYTPTYRWCSTVLSFITLQRAEQTPISIFEPLLVRQHASMRLCKSCG